MLVAAKSGRNGIVSCRKELVLADLVFSIAVPIGAYHPRLRWALESLRVQGVALQVAALDASGDPRVTAVLDEYASLLTYRRTGPDEGQSAAIEEGWAALDGDILGWLNADDFLYPGALLSAKRAFDSEERPDVVTGDSVFLDREGRFYGFHPGTQPPDARILTSNPISQPSTFARRRVVEAAGGLNRDLHYTMDWDLWVRLYRNGATFVQCVEVLSGVTIEQGTKTMGFGRQRRREVLRILAPSAGPLRKAKVMFGMALQYADDRTGLVSRILDTAGSQRADSAGDRRLVAQRKFNRPATLPLVHYDAAASGVLRLICAEYPLRVEFEAAGGAATLMDWPKGARELELPIRLPPGVSGTLTVVPGEAGRVRLSGAILKN